MKIQKIVYILLVVFVSSCAPILPLEIKKTESARVLNYTGTSAEVEVLLRVYNPNNKSFKVSAADLNLKLNGKDIGKGILKNTVKIKRSCEDTYRFVVKGNVNLLSSGGIGAIMDMFTSKGMKLGVEGTITGKKIFLKKKFPINETMNIPVFK